MSGKAIAALIAAAISVWAISGCLFGGDDPEPIALPTETAPAALNKDEFISQADTICEEGHAALTALTGSGSVLVSQQVDIHDGLLRQLRGLGDVTEDQDLLDKFYQSYDEVVAALKREQLASERGDSIGLEAATTAVDGSTFALRQASDAFGFEVCGQEPGASQTDDGSSAPAGPTYTPPSYTPPAGGGGGGGGNGGGVGAP